MTSRNYRLVPGGVTHRVRTCSSLAVVPGHVHRKRHWKKLGPGEARITVVDPNSYMTYQPFLPETAAGSISPRNVVVPLRKVLRRTRVLNGRVVRIEHAQRRVECVTNEGERRELTYDYLVMAAGAVSRTLPIPGLAEHGIGIKTVQEAAYLRNHVLEQLNIADSTDDPRVRRKALNFVFVGGGFAGPSHRGAGRPRPRRHPDLPVDQHRRPALLPH